MRSTNFQHIDEINEGLSNYSTDTAPGKSKITYSILRWLHKASLDLIVSLFAGIMRTGHHPSVLKNANVVIIPKPNKPNYAIPKAYCPIALLECLSKLLERVISKRLNHYAIQYDLISNTQFGGRPNSSVDDATISLVHDIQSAWNQNLKMSVLFFDISGYFNNIHHQQLLYKLRRKRIPEQIVRWLGSFLTGRTVQIVVDDNISQTMNINNSGIPQGSPLSPTLSTYYTADLLEMFIGGKVILPKYSPDPVEVTMYVDNGSIRVVSSSLLLNCLSLQTIYLRVHHWTLQNNLTLDSDKRELIHFDNTRRRRDDRRCYVTLPNESSLIRSYSKLLWTSSETLVLSPKIARFKSSGPNPALPRSHPPSGVSSTSLVVL